MKSLVVLDKEMKSSEINIIDTWSADIFDIQFEFGFIESERPSKINSTDIDDAVFIRVKGFSLNYRDQSIILGMLNRRTNSPCMPIGSEFLAEVIRVPKSEEKLKEGDRVIADMSWTPSSGNAASGIPTNSSSNEYQYISAEKLVRVPDNMSDSIASCFSLGAQTSYSMTRRANPEPNSNVLVTAGTSNTSISIINALKRFDVTIHACTTSRTNQTENLVKLGVDNIITIDKPADIMSNLLDVSRAVQGFDYVFDPYTNVYFQHVLPLMGIGSSYITCGLCASPKYIAQQNDNPLTWMNAIYPAIISNINIMGNCLGKKQDLLVALDEWSKGELETVIDSVYTGGNGEDFINRTFNNRERFGKVAYMY